MYDQMVTLFMLYSLVARYVCLLISLFMLFNTHFIFAKSENLHLLSEKPVDGMDLGNLSGIAVCRQHWWAISDKDDRHIYLLKEKANRFIASVIPLPHIPALKQPLGKKLFSLLLANHLDFEDISCDQAGTIYLVSELNHHVLTVNSSLTRAQWLDMPLRLWQEVNRAHLLQQVNAGFEGLSVDPTGQQLWLFAERSHRGIVQLKKVNSQWICPNQKCVILSENYLANAPAILNAPASAIDFGSGMYFADRLFTLERLTHQVCRRNALSAAVEKCWSFANSVLADSGMRYGLYPFGQAEAMWMDEKNLWIGIDNNQMARNKDAEKRPLIYHFQAPSTGWFH